MKVTRRTIFKLTLAGAALLSGPWPQLPEAAEELKMPGNVPEEDARDMMVFVAIGFVISFLNEARLQAERRAEAAEKERRRGQERRMRPPSL